MHQEEWLTLREAADALGISEVSARRWVKSGKLKATQPGRRYRIPRNAVEELLSPKGVAPSSQEKLFNSDVPDKERRPTDVTVRMEAAELSAEGKPLTITVKREQVLRVLHEQGMSAEKADATWRELERMSA
jgi:excisionase family DNA binding protein